jgi:ParB-like chromosome segregation protein Spo0J
MLSDDELDELAADIKANGLLHPIIRMVDGKTIVDGRNRYEACRRAEVEPWFEDRIRSDEEARALIVSANLQRRNMTKGQQVMAYAIIYPEPEKVGRRKNGLETKPLPDGVHKTRLSQARSVLRAAPDDLALQVLAGAMSIDAALEVIEHRVRDADSETARTARLRAEAPDLAELVTEERMSLSEAIAALDTRLAEAKERETSQREALIRLTDYAYRGATSWANSDFVKGFAERIGDPEFLAQFELRVRVDPEQLDNLIKGAEQLANLLRRICRVEDTGSTSH